MRSSRRGGTHGPGPQAERIQSGIAQELEALAALDRAGAARAAEQGLRAFIADLPDTSREGSFLYRVRPGRRSEHVDALRADIAARMTEPEPVQVEAGA